MVHNRQNRVIFKRIRHSFNMLSESEKWWFTEYVDEIHDVLRRREYDRFSIELKAPQIQWRMHIIQYMLDIAQKLRFSRTTLHLAVYFLDIFMDNHTIRCWRLYLVALTSLRIAAKIEERDFTSAKVERLNASASYSKEDYNLLESIMLKLFDWDVNVPTVATFGSYYAEFVIDESDFNKNENKDTYAEFRTAIKSGVMHFIDRSLFDVSLQHEMPPSQLAAMCLAAARYQWNLEPVWPLNLEKLTRYSWESIKSKLSQLFNIRIIPRNQLENELRECIDREPSED